MDDDEYRALREQLDPGEGYSFVLETILATEHEAADYSAIADRFDQLNQQMQDADAAHRYDPDDCLETLQDEQLIEQDGDRYSLTERGEAFLREDLEDYDRYRETVRFDSSFNQARDLAAELGTHDTVEYDPDAFDIEAIEDYFIDDENMDLLHSFLEHPYETPSVLELAFMTGREEEDVGQEVATMQELDVIDEALAKEDTSFYRITDEAWSMLGEETSLLGPDPEQTAATWKAIYAMVEKPDEIQRYEAMLEEAQ